MRPTAQMMRVPAQHGVFRNAHVIILDIGLPDYDGYFLMQSLCEIPGLAGVPVIVLTGRDRSTHEKRCNDAGAKLFFQKPVDNRALLLAIEQLVG